MGQVPPKSFLPSAPYGASESVNALNPSQPAAKNPQQPLLPSNFQDPGTMQTQNLNPVTASSQVASRNPFGGGNQGSPIMRGLFGAILLFLLLAMPSWATSTISGHIADLGTISQTGNTFVRFTLRGCAGGQPRAFGVALIAPTQGAAWFKDFAADQFGNVSGTLYSTRDATGNGNGDIDCNGSKLAVWYGMTIWQGGKSGPEIPIHAKIGVNIDVTNVTPITTNPVVVAPTGDTTYCRLDAGNGLCPSATTGFGASGDAVFFISSTYGNDSYNGLTPATAKLTLNATMAICPITGCTIYYRLGNTPVSLPGVVTISAPATIYFSKGTLNCTMSDPGTSSGCIVVSSDNVSLFGEGKLTLITQPAAQNIQTLIYLGSQKNFRMAGMLMNTNDSSQTIIGGFYTCVRSAAGSADIRIYDNEFWKCGDRAIDLRGVNRTWIERNYFHQIGLGTAGQTSGGNSVSVDVDGTTQSTDCWLVGNLVEEQGDAFACAESKRVHIIGNTIRGRADFGNTPTGVESGIDAGGDQDAEIIGNHVINARGPQLAAGSYHTAGVDYIARDYQVEGNTFTATASCCGLAATDPRVVLGQTAGQGIVSGQQTNLRFINNTMDGTNLQAETVNNLVITGNSFHNVLSSLTNSGIVLYQNNGTGAVMKNFVVSDNSFTTDNATMVTSIGLDSHITTPDSCSFSGNATSIGVTNDIVPNLGFNYATCYIQRSNRTIGNYGNGTYTAPIQAFLASPFVVNRWTSPGTFHVVGDWALGGNWGTSPSLVVNNHSTDAAFSVTITAGSGSPGVSPNITLTFHDGAWSPNLPHCIAVREDQALPAGYFWARTGVTLTTVTFTMVGTPVAGSGYTLEGICVGH